MLRKTQTGGMMSRRACRGDVHVTLLNPSDLASPSASRHLSPPFVRPHLVSSNNSYSYCSSLSSDFSSDPVVPMPHHVLPIPRKNNVSGNTWPSCTEYAKQVCLLPILYSH